MYCEHTEKHRQGPTETPSQHSMRNLMNALLWLCVARGSALVLLGRTAARPQLRGCARACETPQGDDGIAEFPTELLGPWELTCTLPSVGRTWVELQHGGDCACSSKVGTARDWGAYRKKGRWQLRFVLLDKLKRPNVFEGDVGDSDERRRVVTGVVRGPPKRASRSSVSAAEGVVLGEFEGYLLDN